MNREEREREGEESEDLRLKDPECLAEVHLAHTSHWILPVASTSTLVRTSLLQSFCLSMKYNPYITLGYLIDILNLIENSSYIAPWKSPDFSNCQAPKNGVLHISGDFSTSILSTFQSSNSKYRSAYPVSQLTLTLTIISTCRDTTFRTPYTNDLNCTHPNLQVNRRWWIVANDAAITDLTLARPLSSGYFLPFYFFTPYGLVMLEIFGLFPSTYYCYRYYLMGNSYHGVSDRWLHT